MEVSMMMPSQFLSIVLDESSKKKNSIALKNTNVPRRLSKSMTISHVVPKTVLANGKNVNGKYSQYVMNKECRKLLNGSSPKENECLDLKKRLPRTVLEECIVELASSRKNDEHEPESTENAVIIQPMYAKKLESPLVDNKRAYNVDLRDIFNKVEAVYSDEEDSAPSKKINGTSTYDPSTDPANSFAFACDQCPNKYPNKGALWQHKVAAHSIEKSCECHLCGRKFYRNCSLALHMKCHSDEQNCSCKICGKEFNRMSMLERHAKCHNTEPPAPVCSISTCKICGKKFNDEAALKTHVLAHNEKFTCEQCNVTFSTKQLLDLHFHITHKRSETPFACKVCKASFSNLRELNEHSASHTYEKLRISCHHCGEMFTQRCTYKKHLQLHLGERLSCTICRIDFTQRSSLLRHYKRLHLMNDIPSASDVVGLPPGLTVFTK